nr:hypothetical protein [Blautia coccoides]
MIYMSFWGIRRWESENNRLCEIRMLNINTKEHRIRHRKRRKEQGGWGSSAL